MHTACGDPDAGRRRHEQMLAAAEAFRNVLGVNDARAALCEDLLARGDDAAADPVPVGRKTLPTVGRVARLTVGPATDPVAKSA